MKIGLIDVDGHNFPNFALMKISAWHKAKGDNVEWARPRELFGVAEYDVIYASKIFTFSPDFDARQYVCKKLVKGGTGYDIKSRLPEPIEECRLLDYTIYPQYEFSVQFFSRGCIRHCPFCLVHDKEGASRQPYNTPAPGTRAENVHVENGTPIVSITGANRSKFIASTPRTRIASAARVSRVLIPRPLASISKQESVRIGERKEARYDVRNLSELCVLRFG